MNGLPVKLKKEPLISAIFEIRFESLSLASEVLPGILYQKLKIKEAGDIRRLPIGELPRNIRMSDPNLMYAPLVNISWGLYSISIGDRSIVIGCPPTYPGWAKFRESIMFILDILWATEIVRKMERFSLKYVNVLRDELGIGSDEALNVDISIGGNSLAGKAYTIKAEYPEDKVFHIVSIISNAQATLKDGTKLDGIIVDVDSIFHVNDGHLDQSIEKLPNRLDSLHARNKAKFFECLRDSAVGKLEPVYE